MCKNKVCFVVSGKCIRSFPSLKGGKKEAERERNNTFNNNRETAGAFCTARYQADITARYLEWLKNF